MQVGKKTQEIIAVRLTGPGDARISAARAALAFIASY
jgi:hypothetical protein